MKPILYSYFESSCSWRVRTVLNYKEIEYDIIPISLRGQQDTEEYRKVNPHGFVPALRIDGVTLIESMNIIYYLEETRPEKKLMPDDPLQRAKVRQICDIIVSGIQPLQNFRPLQFVGEARRLEFARYFITKGFDALEKLLAESSGKHCVGDTITLADVCLVPQVYNAEHRFGMDVSAEYPTIVRLAREVESHPAFSAGHPIGQPDYGSAADRQESKKGAGK